MRPTKIFEDQIGKPLGCETPEYTRMTKAPKPAPAERASEYITISVAEYHFLTKAATILETIMQCQSYYRDGLVEAARKILQDMKRTTEAGAEK